MRRYRLTIPFGGESIVEVEIAHPAGETIAPSVYEEDAAAVEKINSQHALKTPA